MFYATGPFKAMDVLPFHSCDERYEIELFIILVFEQKKNIIIFYG